VDYTIINVGALDGFEAGATVDLKAVIDAGIASLNTPLLKVLGSGELTHKLTVRAQKFSKSAQAKIEAAGGTIELLDSRGRDAAPNTEA
jgi:large subunit ribosomal protein L15